MADRAALILRLLQLGPGRWLDLFRAMRELARARWMLRHHSAQSLIRLARRRTPRRSMDQANAANMVNRVAFAIRHVAPRVPWRADCFIQALAAQKWLARGGVPADIFVGVRLDSVYGFEAHAWLRYGEFMVTGGDVSGYAPMVTPDTAL